MKTIKTFFITLALIAIIAGASAARADSGSLSAGFLADVNTGAAPLTVHFSDDSGGSPTGWQWDFGDGSYSTLQNPVYTYNTPGTYTVTLTVTDGALSDTISASIVVTSPLVTTPTPRPDYGRIILVPIRDPHHARPPHDGDAPVQNPPHKEQPPAKKTPVKDQPPVKQPPKKDQPTPTPKPPHKDKPTPTPPAQKSPDKPTDRPKHR